MLYATYTVRCTSNPSIVRADLLNFIVGLSECILMTCWNTSMNDQMIKWLLSFGLMSCVFNWFGLLNSYGHQCVISTSTIINWWFPVTFEFVPSMLSLHHWQSSRAGLFILRDGFLAGGERSGSILSSQGRFFVGQLEPSNHPTIAKRHKLFAMSDFGLEKSGLSLESRLWSIFA